MSKEMRTLFAGMSGPFSRIVLERLLDRNIRIAAVLLNGRRDVPLREFPQPGVSVPSPAFLSSIPSFECGDIGHPQVTDWLVEMSVDVVCVACWNRVIPVSVLDIPRHGFLNVHPSILPAYRGPYPLFWQYRAGEAATGVSVHWMDAGLDTGAIAGQREIQFEDGMRGAEAEALCAFSGGELLADVLDRLEGGEPLRKPQPARGSYFPVPSQEDFALDADWHPRRAFNFMRANAEWGVPFRHESGGTVRWLSDALEWRGETSPQAPGEGTVWVSFRGGSVLAVEGPAVAVRLENVGP